MGLEGFSVTIFSAALKSSHKVTTGNQDGMTAVHAGERLSALAQEQEQQG